MLTRPNVARAPLLAAWLLVFGATPLVAHPGEPCLWRLRIDGGEVTSRLVVPLVYLAAVPELDRDRDGRIAPDELLARRAAVEALLLRHFVVRSGGGTIETAVRELRAESGATLELDLLSRVPDAARELEVESTFFEVTGSGHYTACRAEQGGTVEAFALSVERPAHRIETAAGRAARRRTALVVAALAAAVLAAFILVNRRPKRVPNPA